MRMDEVPLYLLMAWESSQADVAQGEVDGKVGWFPFNYVENI